jgi:hypothetical protein
MDSLPDFVSSGITHAVCSQYEYFFGCLDFVDCPNSPIKIYIRLRSVVIGSKIYLCGGYYGGHPGKEIPYCLTYDHDAPSGTQWTRFVDLPERRAGGGMVYDSKRNALYILQAELFDQL